MLPALKLGLLAGGLGIIALEGVGAFALYGKKEKPSEPSPWTLEQMGITAASSSQKLKDKGTNNKYLVADSVENFYWWNWVFEYRFLLADKNSLDNHFKYVEKGYDTVVNRNKQKDEQEVRQLSLSKACAKAYEMEATTINNNSKLKENVKSFCTPQGNKTLTFS